MSNPHSFPIPPGLPGAAHPTVSFHQGQGDPPRLACLVAGVQQRKSMPLLRTHQLLRLCGPNKAAGLRYRPRIAVSARLPV